MFEEKSDIFLTNIEWLSYKPLFGDREKVNAALARADKILKINAEQEIHTALYCTINYPKNLMRIDNPPAIIYYKGANPNEGFAIISGLSLGVDRLSHIACLADDGKTIAVLAHGLDRVYPASNKKLTEQILLCGGALLSEHPVGTELTNFRFFRRNRLIVGLSSDVDISKCGAYKYAGSDNFEILLFGVSVDGEPVKVYDFACGDTVPEEILAALSD